MTGPAIIARTPHREAASRLEVWQRAGVRHFPTRPARWVYAAWLCLGLALWAGNAWAEPELALKRCLLRNTAQSRSVSARCGRLRVPENYEQPDGKTIELKVAVVNSLSKNKPSDAFTMISGGPGQASTEDYVQWGVTAFADLRKTRDIILVDQRGTGASNPMRCAIENEDQYLSEEPNDAKTRQLVQTCLAELPGDPRYYTTSVAVRDLDTVRAALGYEALNVYGVSYGTRVALQYLRTYPERVRSVVLDGVAPADFVLGPSIPIDAEKALHLIFERCRQDTRCNAAFGDVKNDFQRLRKRLASESPEVEYRDPRSGLAKTVKLTDAHLALVVRMLSYASESAALIPLIIHRAVQDNDLAPLAAQATLIGRDLNDKMAFGMHYAVVCTEDAPFFDVEQATARTASTYLGALFVRSLATACRYWPKGVMSESFKNPVTSDRPALLLSGGLDPVTPPSNAEQARRTLSNARHVVVKDVGHGVARLECVRRMIRDFVNAASVDAINDDCLVRETPSPFFLTSTGPAP